MLVSLHIENYALIRQTDIAFGGGMVAITGETGAGKSIMLGALGLLLGQRADASVLANKEKKCVVEAQFDVGGLGLEPLFEEADVDYDDRLVLRREILPSAKSRAFANDTPVQLAFLKQLGPRIIDIHSQHQTLTLGDKGFRLALLDAIGKPEPRREYGRVYAEYAGWKRELEQLAATEAQNRKEQDYVQFQFDELEAARLEAGEREALEQEAQLLAHAGAVREGLCRAAVAIDNDSEMSVLARLKEAKNALGAVAEFHRGAGEWMARLESALIEIDDVERELGNAAEEVTTDPARLQQVEERLALLYRLEKKHGAEDEAALIRLRDELGQRLQGMASLDERIQELMEKVDASFKKLQAAAERLSHERAGAAQFLAAHVVPTLHELGMPEARFCVELKAEETCGPTGRDSVEMLFDANKGGELRDIAEVASGGELSRLMLAVKSMVTSHSLLPTIIFDEIDTGVSGDMAVAMGRIMRRMAERMQVVAITHLPQIAACGQQHLMVYKKEEEGRTVSQIRELAREERVAEIAKMLSSDPPTPAALQTAKELMA